MSGFSDANYGYVEGVVFENNNIAGVSSGPPQPTVFTMAESTLITYIMDYHYFNGGTLPGTIALRHSDGTVFGPWQSGGRVGQSGVSNAYWEVRPMEVLPAGEYTVVDSSPATWSHGSCSLTIRGRGSGSARSSSRIPRSGCIAGPSNNRRLRPTSDRRTDSPALRR